MAVTSTPGQTKYINDVFTRVEAFTRGRRMKDFESKRKKLEEIEQIYEFNFKNGINTENIEKTNPCGITFYKSNL